MDLKTRKKMKKILFVCSLVGLLFGCSKEEVRIPEDLFPDTPNQNPDPTPNTEVSFDKSEVRLTPNELTYTIRINSEVPFTISCIENDGNWLNYNLQGSDLIVSAYPNNDEIEKKAMLVVVSDEDNKKSDTLTVIQPINKERIALLKIYEALNGDNWSNKENWCSNKPVREWEGVYADGDMGVYRLWLSRDAFIEGEIPECIGDLTYLDNISFEYTNVGGRLPESIGQLVNLERITISNCRFEGKIPESINNCNKLEYVDLTDNSFNGKIPEGFFQCPDLSFLLLSGNKFEEFEINEIPNCHKLATFFMSNNEISSPIPDNLFLMRGLKYFDASNNKIVGEIPNTMSSALNLQIVDLGNNQIDGELPSNLDKRSKLESFNIRNNNLQGKIPDCFISLPELEIFDVRGNNMDVEGLEYLEEEHPLWNIFPQK